MENRIFASFEIAKGNSNIVNLVLTQSVKISLIVEKKDFEIINEILKGEMPELNFPAAVYSLSMAKLDIKISKVYFQAVNNGSPICYIYLIKDECEEAVRCQIEFGIIISLMSDCPFQISEKILKKYSGMTFSQLREESKIINNYEFYSKTELEKELKKLIAEEKYELAQKIKLEIERRINKSNKNSNEKT